MSEKPELNVICLMGKKNSRKLPQRRNTDMNYEGGNRILYQHTKTKRRRTQLIV